MSQPFVDETGVNRVVFAEEPQPRPSTAKPAASRPLIEQPGQQNYGLTVGGSAEISAMKAGVVEMDQICLDNVVASEEIHKKVLPELLRVQEWFER